MKYIQTIIMGMVVGSVAIGAFVFTHTKDTDIESLGADLRVIKPIQGGTGISTTTALAIGSCLKVLSDSPFAYELGACGTGSSGGGGFPVYVQSGGATLNTATTTLNFTPNSFAVVESPADTFTLRVATTTLGLLSSAISDFVSTVQSSITEGVTGMTFTAGNLTVDSGYTIPSTTRETNQDSAFGWGNHASQGYITDGNTNWDNSYSFITDGNTNWDNVYGLITATNATASITHATATNLSAVSSFNLFGGGAKTTANDLCIQLTGSASLCDGVDATGGTGGSSISTSTVPVAGKLAYWTSDTTLSDVATGTLTESVLGLDLDNSTRGLTGGSAAFTLTSGYTIPSTTRAILWDNASGTVTSVAMSVPTGFSIAGTPITTSGTLALTYGAGYEGFLTASGTAWTTFYNTPSNRITAGTGIDWSANTLNTVLTAGDALTLTGEDFDFDGGTVPAGALGGTWASPTVDDDGHNHTSTTISGLDISADTNLSADGTEIILTGDAISLGTSLTFTNATITNSTSTSLFSSLGTFTNMIVNTLTTLLNVVVTGLLDVGGGVLEIPNGSAPTVDSIGELAIDSTSNQLVLYGSEKKVIGNGNIYSTFTYATSTAWTGTTTIPLGTAYIAETWNGVQCFTDAGTLNVSFYDGTNRMNAMNASTTVGTVTLSTNNTFTTSEKRYVDVGTPASSPTKISCTVSKSITSD